jgi:HSP20 family protein
MDIMPWRSRQQSPISSLQSEMNRMLEDFFTQPFGFPMQRTRTQQEQQMVIPALDVKEDDDAITVTAELPGIDPKDIEISVQDDVLEIRGQKSEEKRREDDNYHVIERSYGSFARRIMLPSEVDDEQAEATMNNGVLTLRLPKAGPKAGKKTISVQASGQQQQMGQPTGQPAAQQSGQQSKSQQSGQQSKSQPSGQQQQSRPS